MKKVKAVKVSAVENTGKILLEIIEIEPTLDILYKTIGCNMIEYVCTDRPYMDMIMDEEGRLIDGLMPTVYSRVHKYEMYGSAIFVRTNPDDGETISLTDEDIKAIMGYKILHYKYKGSVIELLTI